jgi:hypothetical protein
LEINGQYRFFFFFFFGPLTANINITSMATRALGHVRLISFLGFV